MRSITLKLINCTECQMICSLAPARNKLASDQTYVRISPAYCKHSIEGIIRHYIKEKQIIK